MSHYHEISKTYRHSHRGRWERRKTTTIKGGQVIGENVTLDTKNLTIESLQDTSVYDSKQQDASAQVTFGYGFSASGSYSKSNIDADYVSVNEQSGVVAGDGGYQVTVAEHTDLKGAIITSTQKAEAEGLNSFSTGTLSVSDVENHIHYEGDSFGISTTASYSFKDSKTQTGQTTTTDTPKAGQQEGQFGFNKSVGYGSEGESQTSVTTSGINTQNITITDNVAQTATGTTAEEIIAQVYTDTTTGTLETDSGALVNSFDAEAVQKELDVQTRVTQTFDTTRQEVKSYLNTKIDNANEIIEDKSGKYTKEQIAEAYQTVDDMQQLGVLVDSISGALYTPADNAAGTVANTLSPAIVYEIGQYFKENEFINDLDNGDRPEEGSPQHILAQALVAGIVAQTAGNDALSAAISAGGAEVLAPELGRWLYGEKDPSKLTSEQKETISAILSLGSSAITVASGGSTTDIVANGMASSVANENNFMNLGTYEVLKDLAANGNKSSQLLLLMITDDEDKSKIAEIISSMTPKEIEIAQQMANDYDIEAKFEDTIVGISEDILQNPELYSNAIPQVAFVLAIYEGIQNDSIIGTVVEELLLRKIEKFTGPIGDKIVEYGGRFYVKIKGKVQDITESVKNYDLNTMRPAQLGGNVKSSPIPVPKKVTASNGLDYKSNPKHTAGQVGNRPNAEIEPDNSLELFENSIPSTKSTSNKMFAVDENGVVHQFTYSNDGTYHWAGTISPSEYSKKLPNEVRKALGVKLK